MARELVLAGQGEPARDTHLHAFQRFPAGRHGVDYQRRRRGPGGNRADGLRLQRGQALPTLAGGQFLHGAGDAQPLPGLHLLAGRQLHEQGIGGGSVAITGILHIDAAQAFAHVGGHHRFDGHGPAFVRAAISRALHAADRQHHGLGGGRQGGAGTGGQGQGKQGRGTAHGRTPGKTETQSAAPKGGAGYSAAIGSAAS